MKVLTLKISDELDATLLAASRSRGLSEAAIVREALEQSLMSPHADQDVTSRHWLAQWRGSLIKRAAPAPDRAQEAARATCASTQSRLDDRLAHLLAKHLR